MSKSRNAEAFGLIPIEQLAAISGLEALQGMLAGRYPFPPIMRTAGFSLECAEPNRAVISGLPKRDDYNPLHTVHAGWTTTLLDTCMACAVWTTTEAGQSFTTMEFKVSLVRPITDSTGLVRAEGTILSRGRRAATAEGRMTDSSGKLLAHATTTCIIFPANGG